MELRHLRYFAAVAKFRNFSRAAENLNIVQSALSRQIRDLEEHIGVPLFERLPRGVNLTRSGETFLADALRILEDADRAKNRARRSAEGVGGSLNIAFINVATRFDPVLNAISSFRRQHPGSELRLHQMSSQAQLDALHSERIDAGFLAHCPPAVAGLNSVPVLRCDYGVALPADHPLVAAKAIRLADLRSEAFIWVSRSTNATTYAQLVNACQSAGFEPNIVQEAETEQAILGLVAAGMGLSFLPLSATRQSQGGAVVKRVEDLTLPLTIDFAWVAGNTSPILSRFIETVELARETPANRLRLLA